MAALQNVMFSSMRIRKLSRPHAESKARALLERVGLARKAHDYPPQLSGGQQQRSPIARGLAMEPEVMLVDKPLEPEMVGEVMDVMKSLASDGMTMVVVTHEMRFARAGDDRVLILADGAIAEHATPDPFFTAPSNDRAKDFLARVLHH